MLFRKMKVFIIIQLYHSLVIDTFIQLYQHKFPSIWFNSVQLIKNLPEGEQLSRENPASNLAFHI